MKAALEFMKTHLITLLCGVVILISFGVGAWGASVDTVKKKMSSELSTIGAGNIQSLKGTAKNEDVINKEKLRGDLFKAEYTRTVDTVKKFNRRTPLMTSVFPKAETTAARFTFRITYDGEIKRLAGNMGAEELPTAEDFEDEALSLAEEMKDLKEQEDESKIDKSKTPRAGWTGAPPVAGPAGDARFGGGIDSDFGGARGGAVAGDFDSPRGGGGGRGAVGGPSYSTAGGIDRNVEPRRDPKYRAFVNKARNIRAYVDGATFHTSPLVHDSSAPSPESMWYAQVGLWIQQDVVRAINALNKEFADKVTDGEANVEHVPVKRLQNLRVIGYQLDGKLIAFPAVAEAGESGRMTASFSDRKSNELFDVVRFEFTAVVDQREVLKLVDRVTKANFNKLLAIEYEAVDRYNEETQGYFYGTSPVIRVRMEFETYMLRDVFDELKPPEVIALLAGKKPGE